MPEHIKRKESERGQRPPSRQGAFSGQLELSLFRLRTVRARDQCNASVDSLRKQCWSANVSIYPQLKGTIPLTDEKEAVFAESTVAFCFSC